MSTKKINIKKIKINLGRFLLPGDIDGQSCLVGVQVRLSKGKKKVM
jgi:predicted YcjX-like family ATPase